MLEHPWLLALFALLVLALIFREKRYFLKLVTALPFIQAAACHKGRLSLKKLLPYFLLVPAVSLLILAAADISVGNQATFRRYIVHNYVLIDDGSGSMLGHLERGLSPQLNSLIAGNRAFLEALENIEREDDEQDLVSLVLFSDDPFIVAYPTGDYDNISKRLDLVTWNSPPLGGGTDLAKALWLSIQMTVERNGAVGGQQYVGEELDNLERRLMGSNRVLTLSAELNQKTDLIAEEIVGTSFIVFTDGIVFLDGSRQMLSTARVLQLCEKLGIRVYLISTMQVSPSLRNAILDTRGQVQVVQNIQNNAGNLMEVYSEIVHQQAGEYVIEGQPRKKSLYLWFGVPGFCLLFLWLLVKNTVSRSLTLT